MLIINHDELSTKIIVWKIKVIREICFLLFIINEPKKVYVHRPFIEISKLKNILTVRYITNVQPCV